MRLNLTILTVLISGVLGSPFGGLDYLNLITDLAS
jgi:hypothetical protein